MENKSYSRVKVFTATKAREREELGDTITRWLTHDTDGWEIVDTVVRQSSDSEFHCLSIIIFLRPTK